ncbi:MAG: hypothetical protein FJ086_09835, partial [Deltaproteobacteria bacterium]|nr:hypothetical protein [Deltaproteobacteria bacterium]
MPRYADFLSPTWQAHLQRGLTPVEGVPGLALRGTPRGLEQGGALTFLAGLARAVDGGLRRVLEQ